MSTHVYKMVEVVGSSPGSTDDAIRNALAEAAKTLRHLDWFEVVEIRSRIVDGKIAHFLVRLKIGFRLCGEVFNTAQSRGNAETQGNPVDTGLAADSGRRVF